MANLVSCLKKGEAIQLEEGKFPVPNARFIGKDCGDFLHLVGESQVYIYGIFLKEDYCSLNGNRLKYDGTITSLNIGKVNQDSDFGQKLKQKYFAN